MEYFNSNAHGAQWPFDQPVAQQQQQQQPDWAAMQLPPSDGQDPLAALQPDSSQMYFANFASLAAAGAPSTQYAPGQQQPFYSSLFDPAVAAQTWALFNGASTSNQPASPTVRISQQSQAQHPQPQAMHHPGTTIDPALVMQNSHFVLPQHLLPQVQSPTSHYVNPSQLVQQQHQQQQQQQQPLSPSSDNNGNVNKSLSDTLKPLLSSKILEKGSRSAVNAIVQGIEKYGGPADVEPRVRLEIMSRIRDNAGDDFRYAWANHSGAMEIVRSWLKAGISGKGAGSDESNDGLIALLHVINRLPLTVDLLKETKLGRYIKHLMKEPPSNAIKSVAHELEKSWREIVRKAEAEGVSDQDKAEDSRNRKRKLTEAGAARDAPPAKKAALAKVIVKKETKAGTTSTTVVSAKSDSSFFSAPKAKPKLPNFKKAPAASTPPPGAVKQEPNVAQSMSIDPFQEAMKSLNKGRFGSPTQSTPPSTTVAAASSSVPDNKTKKRVTFAPEHELRKIRFIDRAVYDDDPADGTQSGHNVRDLDRAEGAAMHKHLFEELIDWYEPNVVEVAPHANVLERGSSSQEKSVQENREMNTLAALYQTPDAVPPSPAEPAHVPDEGPEPQVMMAGAELDNLMNATQPAPSVPDLLNDLAATIVAPMPAPEPEPAPVAPMQPQDSALTTEFLARIRAQLIQQATGGQPVADPMAAAAAPPLPPPLVFGQPAVAPAAYPVNGWEQPQQPAQPQVDNAWGVPQAYAPQSLPPPQDNGRQWGGEQGWRGGRGGGSRGRGRGGGGGNRNNGKKRCNFFAAGRCRYGDQCDYLHER